MRLKWVLDVELRIRKGVEPSKVSKGSKEIATRVA
jgi:hypothetical protein